MALAITSFPVPVSPWIKTTDSTGATRSTSVSNARNFGLDPIKSKVVTALLLYECETCSAFSSARQYALAFILLRRDPLADVRIAIHQLNAGGFALSEKIDAVPTRQSHIPEVENDSAIFPFRRDKRFQLGDMFFVDLAAEGEDDFPVRLPVNS